jgi:site-specific recombinase XerD
LVTSCAGGTTEFHRTPKTINRRISSLSSFYKYLGVAAAELRFPITVLNPPHLQFVGRANHDPVRERSALNATQARRLKGMPAGDTVLEARDRAMLKLFLYTGARIGTVSRLDLSDLRDGEEATLRLTEKGSRRRTIGIHGSLPAPFSRYSRCKSCNVTPGRRSSRWIQLQSGRGSPWPAARARP